jgi:hypothetical protein
MAEIVTLSNFCTPGPESNKENWPDENALVVNWVAATAAPFTYAE